MANLEIGRRSTSDVIFQQLKTDIMALNILPGAKLSEAEVAEKFGVSRQPVREALTLLAREDLVVIRPQKATRVRHFSSKTIANARFCRRALEIEVCKLACKNWSKLYDPSFQRNLSAQADSINTHDTNAFHQLDEDFHGLLTDVAQTPYAFDQIKLHKAHVDRICALSLKQTQEMIDLTDDHTRIYECITRGDSDGVETALRDHFDRIGSFIASVHLEKPDYFEN